MPPDEDRRIAEVVEREQSRLRRFISLRVADRRDAEDILQDVFYRLVEANRLLMPIDHVAAWLFRVARNRIIDFFREHKPHRDRAAIEDAAEGVPLEALLPSADADPEAAYERTVLIEELARAIDELPPDQRAAFVGHEIEGRTFKEMAAESGVSVNTLLSRKRYAVRRLRERLRAAHDDLRKA